MTGTRPPPALVTPSNKRRRLIESCWDSVPDGFQPIDAKHLRVALPVADSKAQCKKDGCSLPAAVSNLGYCPYHNDRYLPKEGTVGCKLLGREFMVYGDGNVPACKKLCACGKATCQRIGYPNNGAFTIPKEHFDEWMDALDLGKQAERESIAGNRRLKQIAYWHFLPEHRELGEDGKWRLKTDLPPYHEAF